MHKNHDGAVLICRVDMTFCPNSPLIKPNHRHRRLLRARRDRFLICMFRLLLQTASLAAFNSVNCLIDRVLQKLQPAADNHFSLAITLSFVLEFLTVIAAGSGSLKFATRFRLRTEQRRCWQGYRCSGLRLSKFIGLRNFLVVRSL